MVTEATARSRVGMEIRALHPAAFKSGEWAEIIGVVNDDKGLDVNGDPIYRLCFQLIWPDGATDFWPVDDLTAEYQFRGERLVFEAEDTGELAEVPKPQRDVCTCATDGHARRCPHHTQADFDAAETARGHSWQLQFGETRLGMPDYTRVRTQCSCDWRSGWVKDADRAKLAWNEHSARAVGG